MSKQNTSRTRVKLRTNLTNMKCVYAKRASNTFAHSSTELTEKGEGGRRQHPPVSVPQSVSLLPEAARVEILHLTRPRLLAGARPRLPLTGPKLLVLSSPSPLLMLQSPAKTDKETVAHCTEACCGDSESWRTSPGSAKDHVA